MTTTTIPDDRLPVVTDAYNRGRTARRLNEDFCSNPYGGKDEHRSWNLGWKDEDNLLCRSTNAR